MYVETWQYDGGAHPNTFYVAYTFGIVAGTPARVRLQDLCRAGTDCEHLAADLLMARLRQNPDALFIQDGTVKRIPHVVVSRFVITPAGLTFLIQPYEVGPYTSGSFRVKIPFAAFGSALNPAGPLNGLRR